MRTLSDNALRDRDAHLNGNVSNDKYPPSPIQIKINLSAELQYQIPPMGKGGAVASQWLC